MSDLMREEFEVAYKAEIERRGFKFNPMVFWMSDGKDYAIEIVQASWWGWQASRESLVIRLPDRPHASEDDQENMSDYEIGEGHGGIAEWDKCRAAIHAAGVKNK